MLGAVKYNHLSSWLEDARRQSKPVMVVGSKADVGCQRAVSTDEGERFARVGVEGWAASMGVLSSSSRPVACDIKWEMHAHRQE
jgi:hypothetical protein